MKPETFAELFGSQAIVPADEFYPTTALTQPHFTSYGLGWFLQDYAGEFVAMHTGSMDGRTAIVGLLPRSALRHRGARQPRPRGIPPRADVAGVRRGARHGTRDWSADLLKLYGDAREKGKAARTKAVAERVTGTRPRRMPLDGYVGVYEHPAWGDDRRAKRKAKGCSHVRDTQRTASSTGTTTRSARCGTRSGVARRRRRSESTGVAASPR